MQLTIVVLRLQPFTLEACILLKFDEITFVQFHQSSNLHRSFMYPDRIGYVLPFQYLSPW
jgi:hypothetical protein